MGDPARVLAVDDEAVVLESLKVILEGQGFLVDTAGSAPEALEKLAKGRYALVVTDLMMPGLGGIEFIRRAKEISAGAAFVMITAFPSVRTAMEAQRAGACDYVTKPFTRSELLQAVRRALTLAQGAPGEAEAPDTMDSSGPAAGPASGLRPGETFHLPGHSWAEYAQDGTVRIGITPALVAATRGLTPSAAPGVGDLVEQGYPMLKAKGEAGEEHTVLAPLTGQVLDVSPAALGAPGQVDASAWLVRIVPGNLHEEIPRLVRGKG